MRIVATLISLTGLCLLTQSSAAPAEPETASTMERCAKLLPHGKRYTFGVSGTIDYTGGVPILHGELSLANETNDDLTQQGAPFAQCFAKLVR